MSRICGNCICFLKEKGKCLLKHKPSKFNDSCKEHVYDIDAACLCDNCNLENKHSDGCRTSVNDYVSRKGIGVVKCKRYRNIK